MLTTAITTFVTCVVLFVVVAVVVSIETKKGYRIVLSSIRTGADTKIVLIYRRVAGIWNHFSQYVVRLGWYYSIHSLLRTILRVLVSVYTYLERMFERNRLRTKQLRRERKKVTEQSHLTKMADHKTKTALSGEEQAALRHEKLEYDH